MEKKKILVIGGGFGGVFAAKELARRGRDEFDIELINNNNYFVFQPLLPEVAAATIHSSDAVAPLRLLLRGIQIRQADVMGIDFDKKTVTVVQGFRRVPVDLPYDELVIALGMSVDLNRFPGLPEHALTMKNLSDAHRLRTHVISCLEMADVATEPELKRELLTFVVVGAGFTGVETVAEVNDLIRRALKYYPNIKPEEIRVYLIEYADRILPTFPADLAEYATGGSGCMASRSRPASAPNRRPRPRSSWAMAASSRRAPSSPPSATVRIRWSSRSTSTCSGDASRPTASCACRDMTASGRWAMRRSSRWSSSLPRIRCTTLRKRRSSPCAKGASSRENLIAKAKGEELKPFAYTSKGSLASLGMSKAVAEVYGVKLSGTLAWLLWRGFYLSFLPGFATKVRVLVNWILNAFVPPNIVLVQSSLPGTRYIHYRKGDKVLEPGMLIDGFYTVVKGSLKLTIDNPETGEHFENVFGPGEHFGERVLLKSSLRTGLVVALEDSRRLVDLAERLYAAGTRLPVHGDLFQGLYREDLRRVRHGLCPRQRRAQPRARTHALRLGERRQGGADGSPANPYISPIMTMADTKPEAAGRPVAKGDHVYLIDGSGYIFRAYHALPPSPVPPTGSRSAPCTASAPCCGSCCARRASCRRQPISR